MAINGTAESWTSQASMPPGYVTRSMVVAFAAGCTLNKAKTRAAAPRMRDGQKG